MGDRTRVEITVPLLLAEQAITAIGEEPDERFNFTFSGQALYTNPFPIEMALLAYDEVNYGNLDCIDALTAAGVPFDYMHGRGDEYGEGERHLRFVDGKPVLSGWDETDAVPLGKLLEYIDRYDEAGLVRYIRDHETRTVPVSWDTQVDHIKQVATRHLLKQQQE